MRKSPPTRGVLVNYLDAHCASRTSDHAHSRFEVCSIEVWHFDLSDFLQLCFCDFCNFGFVWYTRTGFDFALFFDEYSSRRGLGDKGEGSVSIYSDDDRDDHANVIFGSFVEFLGECHDVDTMLTKSRTNRWRRSSLSSRDLQLNVAGNFLSH